MPTTSGWIMRCRDGHVYRETVTRRIFALHLGATKVEHCPVGGHWTTATHVRDGQLTEDEKARLRNR